MTGGELSEEMRAEWRQGIARNYTADRKRAIAYTSEAALLDMAEALLDALDAAEARVAAVEAERDKAEAGLRIWMTSDPMREKILAYQERDELRHTLSLTEAALDAAQADIAEMRWPRRGAVARYWTERMKRQTAEAEIESLTAERDEAREDLRKLREHKIGDPQMAAMHEHAKAHVDALNAYDRVTGGAPLSTSLAWLIEHGPLRPDRALNQEVARLTTERDEDALATERENANLRVENRRLAALVEAGLALADECCCGRTDDLRAALGGTE